VKRIQLRNLPDSRFPPGTPEFSQNLMAWDEAIRQVIRKPLDPQKGAEVEEIRKGIRVLDALDNAKDGVVELEDADWEHLKTKVQAMQWAFVDKRILQFIDDVMDASEQITLNAQLDAAKDGQVIPQPVG